MRIISTAIIFVLVSALMRYLMVSSKRQISANNDGVLELRMNKTYGIIGILGIILAGIIGIIASLQTVKTFSDLLILISIVLFVCILSLPLILVSRNQKVLVSDEKILFYNIIGKSKEILWTDINKVNFNKVSLELKITSYNTSIKIHMHMVGFNKILEIIAEKLSFGIYRDAIESIESVQRRY